MTLKDRKILLVDDNPDILKMVTDSLEIAGFT